MIDTRIVRGLVVGVVSVAVLNCVFVLGLTATSPDVGLRCLLLNGPDTETHPYQGVEIRALPNLVEAEGCLRPEPGDLLLRLGERHTPTFVDFAIALKELRDATIPPGGQLYPGEDVSEQIGRIPTLVKVEDQRLVEIEFWRPGWEGVRTSYVRIHSLPFGEVVLSFVWFVCALGIFLLSALAVWHRPFDRPTRLFFAMCAATLGAYVGGFHWWTITSHFTLTAAFVVSGTLLPVVSLHFFLIYPQTLPVVERRSRTTFGLLYAVPVLSITVMLAVLGYLRWLQEGTPSPELTAQVLSATRFLRDAIYLYLVFAALCFVAMLVALAYGFSTARLPFEQNQMKWIFWAGLVAAVPIGYTLYLAFSADLNDRVRFALGWESRLSMFLASLSFMLAYAVGIVRFKLMLVDQIVSKGMVYYLASCGITCVFGMASAAAMLLANARNISLSSQQSLFLALIFTLVIVILLWLRDRFQQVVDRRFYREKYQLDKALQGISQAIGSFADRQSLAQRMITSCREVLRAECMALYVRDSGMGIFHLLVAEGAEDIPAQFPADPSFLDVMDREGTVHRSPPGIRIVSVVQDTLRRLRVQLLHALEVRGEVVGVVALGAKSNGTPYTAEDLTFLSALGQITSTALHSEEIHQNLKRLNEELQIKAGKIDEQKRRIAMMQAELTSGTTVSVSKEPTQFHRDPIKGSSEAIQRVLETARKVASSEASVLIWGESGTGKEVLAQVIHENSDRKSGPLIRVHCAALSPSLLESELFGHVKGAFTGAHRDRVGRFELANGGTLFLDEIGDISLETQVKLLRVLQTRSFEPVGATRTLQVDVRLITATNQDLKQLIQLGRFREDLYYRLNVISLELPPLRKRQDDILELAFHFLQRASRRVGKQISHIDDSALEALQEYEWPGNIRELENAIERSVVLAEENRITRNDLPAEITGFAASSPRHVVETKSFQISAASTRPYADLVGGSSVIDGGPMSEREALLHALSQCSGNKAQAARMLGMPRSTYYSKLKKHGLDAS